MDDKTIKIFRDASVPKAVFVNIIPSIVGMIMVLIYNLADTFFIGQSKVFVGQVENDLMVGAVGVGTPAFMLFMAVGLLFGIGGTSLIARMLGEGKGDDAKHVSSFCFWSAAIIGVIGGLILLLFARPLGKMLGATPDMLDYVAQYISILAFGIPFLIIGNSFSNILRAEGQPVKAMIGMILGNLTNIILDPIFILGFKWYIQGAALATVIGNVVAAAFYIFHLTSKKTILSIKPKDYRIGHGVLIGVFAIGIPASLNNLFINISNIVINKLMQQYGAVALSGLSVALKVNLIAVLLLIGLGTGIQPLLGYLVGARNRKRYMQCFRFTLFIAVLLSVVMTAICYFGARPMVQTVLSDAGALELGIQFCRTLIISGPILGVLFVVINAIQAMGAALPSLILSISRQGLFYFPIVLAFNAIWHTPETIVLAQPVTDYIATLLAIILFIIAIKKYLPAHHEMIEG